MAIVLPESKSTEMAEIRRVPVPGFLAELGVQFAYDEALNARLVMFPDSVREKCNVIDPVTSLVQADPNWTPRISIAHLNPDATNGPHFYKQAGNKLAPSKQALEVLGKAAGILYTKTSRVPRAELDAGEIGYRAVVGVRRSDGTVEEISREKIWVSEAERAEIEDAVTRSEEWKDGKPIRGSHKFGIRGEQPWEDEVQKRWLKELKDRSAKTESKAVLRAIRSALQIPHTFTPAEAAKPFLIVGFNFTPDYNDADTKRALIAAGLNAQASMYGPPAIAAAPQTSPAGSLGDESGEDDRQASDVVATSPTSEAAGDTDGRDDDSESAEDGYNPQEDVSPDVAAARKAGMFVPPFGQHLASSRSLDDILALGAPGLGWFRKVCTGSPDLPEGVTPDAWATFYRNLEAFTKIYLPDLYETADFGLEIEL